MTKLVHNTSCGKVCILRRISAATSRRQLPRELSCVVVIVLAVGGLKAATYAQEPRPEATIAYRLVKKKTMHFDDAQKFAAHAEQVKKLGCEVSKGDHEGHGDVTYSCPKWRSLSVADDKLAHQWEAWLKGAGFETLHGHTEDGHEHAENHVQEADHDHAHEHGNEAHEEVTYRLTKWVTFHPKQQDEAQELVSIFKGLGCEVQENQHGGHADIAIRCEQLMHIECSTHEDAERWQQWLAKIGFEANHQD